MTPERLAELREMAEPFDEFGELFVHVAEREQFISDLFSELNIANESLTIAYQSGAMSRDAEVKKLTNKVIELEADKASVRNATLEEVAQMIDKDVTASHNDERCLDVYVWAQVAGELAHIVREMKGVQDE